MIHMSLIRRLRARFALDWRGIHGAPHWARVRRIGLRLAADTGASPAVVELFAFLHDACRDAEVQDPAHGLRAARFAESLNADVLGLDAVALAQLTTACEGHNSHGLSHADPTIATCWDADRLDLGRIGVLPDPRRLCTPAAQDPAMIAWAVSLSTGGRVTSRREEP